MVTQFQGPSEGSEGANLIENEPAKPSLNSQGCTENKKMDESLATALVERLLLLSDEEYEWLRNEILSTNA